MGAERPEPKASDLRDDVRRPALIRAGGAIYFGQVYRNNKGMDLKQFADTFGTEEQCVEYLARTQWPHGPVFDILPAVR